MSSRYWKTNKYSKSCSQNKMFIDNMWAWRGTSGNFNGQMIDLRAGWWSDRHGMFPFRPIHAVLSWVQPCQTYLSSVLFASAGCSRFIECGAHPKSSGIPVVPPELPVDFFLSSASGLSVCVIAQWFVVLSHGKNDKSAQKKSCNNCKKWN